MKRRTVSRALGVFLADILHAGLILGSLWIIGHTGWFVTVYLFARFGAVGGTWIGAGIVCAALGVACLGPCYVRSVGERGRQADEMEAIAEPEKDLLRGSFRRR